MAFYMTQLQVPRDQMKAEISRRYPKLEDRAELPLGFLLLLGFDKEEEERYEWVKYENEPKNWNQTFLAF